MEERIRRSKRSGKVVATGVLLVSMVFGAVLVQALILSETAGREDLALRALGGLALLVGLNVLSAALTRRQHRMLDEAREELEGLEWGEGP